MRSRKIPFQALAAGPPEEGSHCCGQTRAQHRLGDYRRKDHQRSQCAVDGWRAAGASVERPAPGHGGTTKAVEDRRPGGCLGSRGWVGAGRYVVIDAAVFCITRGRDQLAQVTERAGAGDDGYVLAEAEDPGKSYGGVLGQLT